jgi:hypothetical protein
MRKLIATMLAGAFAVTLLVGCQTVKTPAMGVLYTDVQAPESVTSNAASSKMGSATATTFFGLIATGDASVDMAAKNGGITKIHHVDYHSKNILGVYGTYTVTVYGE